MCRYVRLTGLPLMISVTRSLYSGAFRMAARNPPPPAPVRLQPTHRERCTVYRAEHYQWGHVHTMQELPSFLDEELHWLRQWTCERETPVGLHVSYSTCTVYAIHITVGPYSMCSSYTLLPGAIINFCSLYLLRQTPISLRFPTEMEVHTMTMQVMRYAILIIIICLV